MKMKYAELVKLSWNDLKWLNGLLVCPNGHVISEEEAAEFLTPQSMANLRRLQYPA